MTLSLWILISFTSKAFWETSLWGVLGEALGYFFCGGAFKLAYFNTASAFKIISPLGLILLTS